MSCDTISPLPLMMTFYGFTIGTGINLCIDWLCCFSYLSLWSIRIIFRWDKGLVNLCGSLLLLSFGLFETNLFWTLFLSSKVSVFWNAVVGKNVFSTERFRSSFFVKLDNEKLFWYSLGMWDFFYSKLNKFYLWYSLLHFSMTICWLTQCSFS